MTTSLYAAYGSNLHPVRLNQRVPSARLVGTSAVSGFELRFHKRSVDGSGKCDIVETDGDIFVAVYDIQLDEKHLLDRVEGLGSGYDEIQISVPGHGRCWSYAASQSHVDPALVPYGWYRELVILGCEHNSFPAYYIQRIRETAERRDQDSERHDRNIRLVRSIQNGT